MLVAAMVGMVCSGAVAVAAVRRLSTGKRMLDGFAGELLMASVFLAIERNSVLFQHLTTQPKHLALG